MGVRSDIGVQNVQKIQFGADKGQSHKTSRSHKRRSFIAGTTVLACGNVMLNSIILQPSAEKHDYLVVVKNASSLRTVETLSSPCICLSILIHVTVGRRRISLGNSSIVHVICYLMRQLFVGSHVFVSCLFAVVLATLA